FYNMKALVFGHVCIDKNISEAKSYIAAGGPAVFINKTLNRFFCQTKVVAPYGKDFFSYSDNIPFYPKASAHNSALIYENITKNNLRIQKALNRTNDFNVKITKRLIGELNQADIIFIAPLLPNIKPDYVRQINTAAKKDALKVLLPQGYFRDFDQEDKVIIRKFFEANEILPFIDIVVASEQDHPQIKNLARKWIKSDITAVVITLGDKGALIVSKNKEKHIPTIPVPLKEIVDSVGCGDVFSAGLAYYYKKSGDIKEAVDNANQLARSYLLGQS
ncbi:MAG: carbohydrate kinase family protein, partial [bacterium]|nr:carbohydrate kinase family protein [bacterium]